ncbi:hypothetical protein ACN23B_15995 [Anabaena sp. FACHB-709]|uniref:DUF4265 domain-containing protein n=1 Tax=Trichormus variabilis NIES-23 TaxID=1973479 RepID=A0A1Z4KIJ4_ANAVA|nr:MULTISPECIES: hypothetical protein [Nostocaceae]RUR89464.1 hypothetical protein DSM107007_01500 [Nostoc sp. PCC 7120 = FACHB-418]BAY68811.1 hypothetical protein NIES23_16000 [Trichormus variabilis NIES-23]
MSVNRNWCWELAASGNGPDWLCVVEVTPESIPQLEAVISQLSLPSFTYIPVHDHDCYHLFVNESHAEAFKANLEGKNPVNIWIYHSIEIHSHIIKIECGYGGYPDSVYHTIETSFLLDLCNNPNIAIAQWHLYAGGMGYDYITVKAGKTSGELQQYIIG